MSDPSPWTPLTPDGRFLRADYTVGRGGGPATVTAFALPEGGWAVMSAPNRHTATPLFDALDAQGGVAAIIAPNAFHTMGVGSAAERYPDAGIYTPAPAVERISRVAGRDAAPLTALAPRLADGTALFNLPHIAGADTAATVQTPNGPVWLLTDILPNLPDLGRAPLSWLLSAFGFRAGLHVNKFAARWVIKAERPALADWLTAQWAEAPPAMLVPGHGPVVAAQDSLDALPDIIRLDLG